MTGSLIALQWTVIGGCILAVTVIVAAFAASLVADLREAPVPHWQPGGPWCPRTDPVATAPLGSLPAAVELELAKLAAMVPDRPA